MARNGTDFGIRVSGLLEQWFTALAELPRGLYFPGFSEADGNLDIGDSAITETGGLGAFAMAAALGDRAVYRRDARRRAELYNRDVRDHGGRKRGLSHTDPQLPWDSKAWTSDESTDRHCADHQHRDRPSSRWHRSDRGRAGAGADQVLPRRRGGLGWRAWPRGRGRPFTRHAMTTPALGSSIRRNEDPRLLVGLGRYVDDVRLHAPRSGATQSARACGDTAGQCRGGSRRRASCWHWPRTISASSTSLGRC